MTEINLKTGGGTEQYLKPELEVIELSGENIVTASGSVGCSPVNAVVTPGLDPGLCFMVNTGGCTTNSCPLNSR